MRPILFYRPSIIYSPVAFPKYMTLNDLNGLNGHFTSNFHYYELTLRVLLAGFESIIYLFTVESVYIRVTSGDVGSGAAIRRMFGIREKLRIFLVYCV